MTENASLDFCDVSFFGSDLNKDSSLVSFGKAAINSSCWDEVVAYFNYSIYRVCKIGLVISHITS
jgi:hypothetical protein